MAPLVMLVLNTVIARLVGLLGLRSVDSWGAAAAIGLAGMFVLTGTSHFVPRRRREGLIAIVPPQVGHGAFLVSLTGVFELLGTVGLLVPPQWGAWRAASAWCLIALLVVMFPANIYAAAAPRSQSSPQTTLVLRSALQVFYIAAALFVALSP